MEGCGSPFVPPLSTLSFNHCSIILCSFVHVEKQKYSNRKCVQRLLLLLLMCVSVCEGEKERGGGMLEDSRFVLSGGCNEFRLAGLAVT